MVVTVSTDNPRSVKALALLPAARRWVHGTRKCDGRAFLIAPGSNGHSYYVDANGAECTCPDRQTRRTTCKHMLAARLLLVERGQAEPAPAPKRGACRGCGGELPVGLIAGLFDDCDVDMAFLTVLGPKAARSPASCSSRRRAGCSG